MKRNEIPISMDGRGRVLDHVFIERFWYTVKYEEMSADSSLFPLHPPVAFIKGKAWSHDGKSQVEPLYLNHYESVWNLENRLTNWYDFYCHRRRHSALDYRRLAEVYFMT